MFRPDIRTVGVVAVSSDLRKVVEESGENLVNCLERIPAFVGI